MGQVNIIIKKHPDSFYKKSVNSSFRNIASLRDKKENKT